MDEHDKLLKKAFATQAESYAHPLKARYLENVAPMIELVAPLASDRLLDVATGSGFTALGFAVLVRNVVGVDVAAEAVAVATRQAKERGIANAEFRVSEMENLPFVAGSFEIVTCRFTFHHFSDPGKVLREMKRVLAPGGRIMLYDILSSPDTAKAEVHNRIEKTRDPSHVRMLQAEEYVTLFRETGLEVRSKLVLLTKREFEEWMEIVGADAETIRKTRALFESIGENSGLGVRISEGKISFTQTNVAWLLASSRDPGEGGSTGPAGTKGGTTSNDAR